MIVSRGEFVLPVSANVTTTASGIAIARVISRSREKEIFNLTFQKVFPGKSAWCKRRLIILFFRAIAAEFSPRENKRRISPRN